MSTDELLRNIARAYATGGANAPIISHMPGDVVNVRMGQTQVVLNQEYWHRVMGMVNELLASNSPRRAAPSQEGFVRGSIASQAMPSFTVSRPQLPPSIGTGRNISFTAAPAPPPRPSMREILEEEKRIDEILEKVDFEEDTEVKPGITRVLDL